MEHAGAFASPLSGDGRVCPLKSSQRYLARLFLVRHAQNEWVRTGKLAGWTPNIHLDSGGKCQAEALGKRLATVKLQAVYSSPLERAIETAQVVLQYQPGLALRIEEGVGEVRYGKWTGRHLRRLARTSLWQIVQTYPSGMVFPGGEGIREMQARAVETLERIAKRHLGGTVAVVSHADVIKVVLAHYAGIHLDLYQRLIISPASISIIDLHQLGPRIVCLNDTSHYEGQREGTKDT